MPAGGISSGTCLRRLWKFGLPLRAFATPTQTNGIRVVQSPLKTPQNGGGAAHTVKRTWNVPDRKRHSSRGCFQDAAPNRQPLAARDRPARNGRSCGRQGHSTFAQLWPIYYMITVGMSTRLRPTASIARRSCPVVGGNVNKKTSKTKPRSHLESAKA